MLSHCETTFMDHFTKNCKGISTEESPISN